MDDGWVAKALVLLDSEARRLCTKVGLTNPGLSKQLTSLLSG